MTLEPVVHAMPGPVLIVSTAVGRGMFALGEALRQRFARGRVVEHVVIEDFLPRRAVTEDYRRYRFISDRLPVLLNLVYKVPVFYYRKYLRERLRAESDLGALQRRIEALEPRTVICVSHRPAFWVSSLKRRHAFRFGLWGVLGEYGDTLGWRYIFWDQVDGFLSPLAREELSYPFPPRLEFHQIDLPARREFETLRNRPGNAGAALLVCGYWGQGPIVRVTQALLADAPGLRVHAVCGENVRARERAERAFAHAPGVVVHGAVPSLAPLLAECGSVVTKPGISTLLEARAAARKIFLLPGMPVAEDNNARHALAHFGAEWFSGQAFRRWQRAATA